MRSVFVGLLLALLAVPAIAEEREKLSDDPTKIITRIGIRYADFATVSGSVAFGPVSKINASYSENDDWTIGGSYLFRFGIVNASAARTTLSNGTSQTRYSVGTFLPLSARGIEPAGWQLFPAFGLSYTKADSVDVDLPIDDAFTISTSSESGYAGILALKPLSPKWTFKGVLFGAARSDDFTSLTVGAGLTYRLTPRDSLSVFATYIDTSSGQRDQVGLSYTREF